MWLSTKLCRLPTFPFRVQKLTDLPHMSHLGFSMPWQLITALGGVWGSGILSRILCTSTAHFIYILPSILYIQSGGALVEPSYLDWMLRQSNLAVTHWSRWLRWHIKGRRAAVGYILEMQILIVGSGIVDSCILVRKPQLRSSSLTS